MKTLYISDLDGTLLNSHAELSDYTVKTLNCLTEKGIHFSLATARTAATALQMLENVAINIPIVLMNGVLIYDLASKEYIKKEALSPKIAEDIIGAMREVGQAGLMYTLCCDKMFTYHEATVNQAIRDFINERKVKYNKVFTQVNDFLDVKDEIIYFTFLDNEENIERLCSRMAGISGIEFAKYRDIYTEKLWYLEVFSSAASKYNAVRFLREYGNYERVIGFGDNLNDIPLFRACDECYAVANAKDEVKAIATHVIGSNDDDGVAKWLERR
ncbi:MAG: HAD family hydrolase [Oscillospiraceae bacterium]